MTNEELLDTIATRENAEWWSEEQDKWILITDELHVIYEERHGDRTPECGTAAYDRLNDRFDRLVEKVEERFEKILKS